MQKALKQGGSEAFNALTKKEGNGASPLSRDMKGLYVLATGRFVTWSNGPYYKALQLINNPLIGKNPADGIEYCRLLLKYIDKKGSLDLIGQETVKAQYLRELGSRTPAELQSAVRQNKNL